jgi:uracil phosphoribosyltransferase
MLLMMNEVIHVSHPLVQHKLTLMRDRETSTKSFRELAREIATLLCYEVTRDLPLEAVAVETPLEQMQAPMLSGKKLMFVPILRAGLGLLDGMLDLVPSARVAHIGLYRDPESLESVEYYFKPVADLGERLIVVIDPMLATGNTLVAAASRLKAHGAREIRVVCLLAAPEGLARFHARHPEIRVWTAAIDTHLDAHGYIRPGLGDAGDRLYGTR